MYITERNQQGIAGKSQGKFLLFLRTTFKLQNFQFNQNCIILNNIVHVQVMKIKLCFHENIYPMKIFRCVVV